MSLNKSSKETMPPQDTTSSKTMNIIEASKFLCAHKETVRRMVAAGILPGAKIGRAWIFLEEDLKAFIRAQYKDNCKIARELPAGFISPKIEEEYNKLLGLK